MDTAAFTAAVAIAAALATPEFAMRSDMEVLSGVALVVESGSIVGESNNTSFSSFSSVEAKSCGDDNGDAFLLPNVLTGIRCVELVNESALRLKERRAVSTNGDVIIFIRR